MHCHQCISIELVLPVCSKASIRLDFVQEYQSVHLQQSERRRTKEEMLFFMLAFVQFS